MKEPGGENSAVMNGRILAREDAVINYLETTGEGRGGTLEQTTVL